MNTASPVPSFTHPPGAHPPELKPVPWMWWLGTAVGIAVWAAVGTFLDEAYKPLGPYAWGWGTLAGAAAGYWCRSENWRLTVAAGVWIGVLISAGETGQVLANYQRYYHLMRAQQQRVPQPPGWNQAVQDSSTTPLTPADIAAKREFLEAVVQSKQRARERLEFRTFLAQRLSRRSPPAEPWPLLFLLAEVAGGTVLGVWLCVRLARPLPVVASGQSSEPPVIPYHTGH